MLYLFIGIVLIFFGATIAQLRLKRGVKVVLSPTPSPEILEFTLAKVTKVIDGDTIVINTGQHVRYIGINTPEIETNECFATEASEVNKNLVLGKEIKLVKDVSEMDKYGRSLRYVFVGNYFINDYLAKSGYAKTMAIPPDVKYINQILESEKYARENKLGLWGKCGK